MSLATHEVFVNETRAETRRDGQTTGPRDVLCVHNQAARKSGDMESRTLSPTRHKNIKFLDCRKQTGDSHHLSLSGRVRFCQEHSGEKDNIDFNPRFQSMQTPTLLCTGILAGI